jgi:hypothetical protein
LGKLGVCLDHARNPKPENGNPKSQNPNPK